MLRDRSLPDPGGSKEKERKKMDSSTYFDMFSEDNLISGVKKGGRDLWRDRLSGTSVVPRNRGPGRFDNLNMNKMARREKDDPEILQGAHHRWISETDGNLVPHSPF